MLTSVWKLTSLDNGPIERACVITALLLAWIVGRKAVPIELIEALTKQYNRITYLGNWQARIAKQQAAAIRWNVVVRQDRMQAKTIPSTDGDQVVDIDSSRPLTQATKCMPACESAI